MDLVTLETKNGESLVTYKGTIYYRGGRVLAKKFAADLSRKAGLSAWVNIKASGERVEVAVPKEASGEG